MHGLFHSIALLAFVISVAIAFLALAAPLVFPDLTDVRPPAVRASLTLIAVAAAGLAIDWLVHSIG